jgi:two-component system LytT family response regulator
LTAIIVEDEVQSLNHLQILLKQLCPQLQLQGTAGSVQEGFELFHQTKPDLLFLDIELGTESGFDLLSRLSTYTYRVIFTTAFDQYGVRAIKFSALDYLLKPIDPCELSLAVDKAINQHLYSAAPLRINHLLDQLQVQSGREKTIAIAQGRELIFIQIADILYCQSSNNYTTFFLRTGEKLVSSKGIFHYDELLTPLQFLRVHQSYLVNLRYIRSLHTEQYIVLHDKTQIPVARLKMALVRKALLDPGFN